jgi:hypothetical protein
MQCAFFYILFNENIIQYVKIGNFFKKLKYKMEPLEKGIIDKYPNLIKNLKIR